MLKTIVMKQYVVKPCVLSALILLISFSVSAQLYSTRGKVSDDKGVPIANATVHVLNRNISVLSDSAGLFQFDLPRGTYIIQVTASGFAAANKSLSASADNVVSISLNPSSEQLDEVVVTAQKREEAVQSIPVSVTVFTAQKVREYRLWSTEQIRGLVPNLYSSNPGDNRNVTSIRGIATTSYDPAVATYIDGVNQFNLDTYIANLIDVERIEVLRGPQGTLYGRNAMGGVINIISKEPTNNTSGYAEVNIGNYSQQRYSAGVRLPVVANKLYAGVAIQYSGHNGFYKNVFNNTSFDKQHSFTGNYFLKYKPAANWNISLNFKHSQNRNNGPFTLINGVDAAFEQPYVVNQNATTTMADNVLNTSLSISHSAPLFNFTSQTAYQSNRRIYQKPIDGDFSPIDGVSIINDYGGNWNRVSVLTQEFRFSNSAVADGPFKWTVGSYFFLQDNPVKQGIRFGEDADLLGSPDKNFSIINTSEGKGVGAALFGQAEFALTKRLSFIAGVRYDYERKKQSVLGQYQKDPDPNPVFDIQPDTTATSSFTAFSPKAGLVYLVSSNSTFFFTYSRGFRAGGLTPIGSDPSQPPLYPYKPEYSNNLEVGYKNSLFNNKLFANFTLFYTRVEDVQVPTLVLPDAITITRNAGEMESKGFEVELSSTLISGFDIDYRLGITDAKYKSLKVAGGGGEIDLAGRKQIFTPNATSMLAPQYSFPISRNRQLKLVARAEWFYFGKQHFDLSNSISQSSYHLLNARFGVSAPAFEVMLWSRNLTDTRYIDYAYDFGAVHLADPRTYGVTVATRF